MVSGGCTSEAEGSPQPQESGDLHSSLLPEAAGATAAAAGPSAAAPSLIY